MATVVFSFASIVTVFLTAVQTKTNSEEEIFNIDAAEASINHCDLVSTFLLL